MNVTESALIFPASAGIAGRFRLEFSLDCSMIEQSSPFLASEGFNSRPLEIGQPLQVVASRHHDHGEVRLCLANGADQLATHLLHCAEDVLHTGARPGDPLVAPLLALG